MTAYHIIVRVYAPYPIEQSFTERASSPATAAARAIRKAHDAIEYKRRIEHYQLTIKRL